MQLRENDSASLALVKLSTPTFLAGYAQQTAKNIFSRHPKDTFDHGPNAETLLFIPGMGCRSRVMQLLGETVLPTNNVAYAPDFPPFGLNTCSIDISAQMLAGKIAEIQKNCRGAITLVAHSLGGLIALKALPMTRGKNHRSPEILSIIAMGAPFKGTPSALLPPLSFTPACRQIQPKSSYLQNFESVRLEDTKLRCHVSGKDSLVPAGSQTPRLMPDGSYTIPVESVQIHKPFQHTDFILGNRAEEFALQYL